MTILNGIFFWIAVILNVITACNIYLSSKNRNTTSGESALSPNTFRAVLFLIILMAVLVRVYAFGSVPGGMNQDGAMAAVDGKALADHGTDRFGMKLPVHLTAWGYGQMSALLSYLIVPFVRVAGLSPLTARLPQLLVSLAGLLCLYGFIRNSFGKNAALAVLFFAAINPWHILQSRWALDCNLFPHFFLMGVFFLDSSLRQDTRQRFRLCVSMILFGLCMYCYGVSIYTVPFFLLIACLYLLLTKKLSPGRAILAFLVYMAVAWPFIAVMTINFFRWDSIEFLHLFTLPFFPDSVRSADILFFSDDMGAQLIQNFRSLLNVTLLQKKDLPWNDVAGFGTMYLFSLPFAATGLYSLACEFRRRTGAKMILFFLLTGIWCGLITRGVNVNRLNIIYYPVLILCGLGIYQTLRHIHVPPVRGSLIPAFCLAFTLFIHTYFTAYAEEIGYFFFQDFSRAVASLKDSDVEKFYITPDCRHEGPTPSSEILTLFWHEIDAEYFQGKTVPPGELPYREKYIFQLTCDLQIDPSEDAAFVIPAEDISYFDHSLFDFEQFGSYYVITTRL